MILTGDLHASPEELQFLRPRYLRTQFGNKSKIPNELLIKEAEYFNL